MYAHTLEARYIRPGAWLTSWLHGTSKMQSLIVMVASAAALEVVAVEQNPYYARGCKTTEKYYNCAAKKMLRPYIFEN